MTEFATPRDGAGRERAKALDGKTRQEQPQSKPHEKASESERKPHKDVREHAYEKEKAVKGVKRAAEGEPMQVSLKDAHEVAAKPIRSVQSEQFAEFSPQQLRKLREFVISSEEYKPSTVAAMSPAELLVAAQKILPNVKLTESKSTDGKKKGKWSELEEVRARREIDEAIHGEVLTVEKAEQLVRLVETEPEGNGETTKVETRPIVRTTVPIETLSRDEVVRKFKEAEVDADVPDDWDSLKEGQRQDIISEARIENEVEPVIEEIEVQGKKYLTWQRDKEVRVVYGLGEDLTPEEAKAILGYFCIRERVPRDWSRHGLLERRDWLEERGVRPLIKYEEVDGRPVVDADFINLTTNQIERILNIKVPENWPALNRRDRASVLLANKVLPKIAGGGIDKPEWSDYPVPNPEFTNTRPVGPDNQPQIPNPEANARQQLGTVIKRRLQLMHEGLGPVTSPPAPANADWLELGDRLDELVNYVESLGYEDFRLAWQQVDQTEHLYKIYSESNSLADFNTAIPAGLQSRLRAKLSDLIAHFEALDRTDPRMTVGARRTITKDIDNFIQDRLGSVTQRWITLDQFKQELFSKCAQTEEPSWAKGFIDWYVLERKLPEVEDIMTEERDLSQITNPDEFEVVARRGLRKAEMTNLGSQELSNYYQKILNLLTNFPARTRRAIEMRNMLSAEIQGSLLMNQLFILVESSEGSPEKMAPLFEQIKNLYSEKGINTLQVFLRRFRMTYSDDSPIEDDNKNPIFKDAVTGEVYNFNLLSDMLNIYYDHLAEERLLLNLIEQAQKEKWDFSNDQVWGRFEAQFTRLNIEAPKSTDAHGNRKAFLEKEDIDAWFKHNTLLGASNEVFVHPRSHRKDPNDMTYIELWNHKMVKKFKDHLINVRGMDPNQVKKMEVIVRATNLTAQRFVLAFGWSEFDGIDTKYDPKTHRAIDTIFSTRTPFNARFVDSVFKHYRNERRGKVSKTNDIFEETLPLGYSLPTCRVLVRFTDVMYMKQGESPPVQDVAGLNTRWGLGLTPGATAKEAIEKLSAKLQDVYSTSKEHAEGVAIADMVDHGNIRFGVKANNPDEAANLIDWEEEVRDLTRFNFTDIFGDRAAAIKMYDRGAFQELLRHPTFANFMKVYGELFYSGRDLRLFPNIKEGLKALHKIRQHSKEWFKHEEKGSAMDTYTDVKVSVESGRLDPKDGEEVMKELLGIWKIPGVGPIRGARMWADFTYLIAKKNLNPMALSGHLLANLWQLIVEAFKQSAQQLGATR